MLASEVLTKAGKILNDDNVAWTEAELLGWLNDGRVVLVRIRPDAYTVREVVQLAAGTAQTLSDDYVALIDVVRNMGTSGSTPGPAITMIDKDRLDRWRPTWHSEDASATVKHFVRNPLTPREYYVYPAQPASNMGWVERIASKVPAAVATDTDIALGDQWVPALVDYVCGRAHAKDADTSANGKNVRHMTDFYEGLKQ